MDSYKLYGAEMSPYSVKVRAYLRYKGIPHQWIVRSMDRMKEFGEVARLPLIPCLAGTDGSGKQDSTLIMEWLEATHPEPPVLTGDPVTDFLSALLEEYADEWVNKAMFHYRWYYDQDAESAACRIAAEIVPAGSPPDAAEQMAPALKARMIPRLSFVGSGRDLSNDNAAMIENSFKRMAGILEGILHGRDYLFGNQPVFADFGLYAQLKELLSDPTPGAWLKANTPTLVQWINYMEAPEARESPQHATDTLPCIQRLLSEEVAACYLPWADANSRALASGDSSFTVRIDGTHFTQQPQKYHAKSLAEIRRKYAEVKDNPQLRQILDDTGCLPWLTEKDVPRAG